MKQSRISPILSLLLLALATAACDRTPVVAPPSKENDPYKENMINANKVIEQSEKTQIESYIARRGWQMRQMSNGAWVEEYAVGRGSVVDYEDTINVVYTINAINGSTIYDHQSEQFVVGRNKPTVGLDAAVQGMHHGSRARVILPSSLGYGVVGDGDRIPSRAILIYDIEIK